MSFNKLDPEIWLHILGFLRPTIPKPLSGLSKQEAVSEPIEVLERLLDENDPGVTRRKDIRSDGLATLMRTSIAFNQLAAIPLYRQVITDDYAGLINNLGAPSAHPLIHSKANLLGLTRHMSLEYFRKGINFDSFIKTPSYPELMALPHNWTYIAPNEVDQVNLQVLMEITPLQRAISQSASIADPPFPSLTRLTTGMLFGGQGSLWMEGMKRSQNQRLKTMIGECQDHFVATFRRSPLLHFCQRGHAGPLFLPNRTFSWHGKFCSPPYGKLMFTIHFSISPGSNQMPIALGHRTLWHIEPRPPRDHLDVVVTVVGDSLGRGLRRISDSRGSNVEDDVVHPNFDLMIYASTTGKDSPSPVSPPAARQETEAVLFPPPVDLYDESCSLYSASEGFRSFSQMHWQKGKVQDRFEWTMASCDNICRACGWDL